MLSLWRHSRACRSDTSASRLRGPSRGVIEGITLLLGHVHLAVTFGTRENYRTKLISFDVAHLGLPYNVILGYPALAKFMAVTHHAYNTVKLLG